MTRDGKLRLIAEAIGAFTTKLPGQDVMLAHYDLEAFTLQKFIVDNLKPEFEWMTGNGIIQACEIIVEDAKSNGNVS